MVKEFREKPGKKNRVSINECRNEIPETKAMPANRVALYNGILRDRVQRMGCCHWSSWLWNLEHGKEFLWCRTWEVRTIRN